MAHLIDNSKGYNAFTHVGATAWHGLGEKMEAISAQDALQKAGLDYTVLKMPNIHLINEEALISEDSFFTYRTDVNKILGSRLGKDYAVMQNIEALNIVDEILQSGKATIETAGAIDEGRKCFICLKLNTVIKIGNNDVTEQFLVIANSHDGSLAVTAKFTNVRVVCNNTLCAALGSKSGQVYKFRHTSTAGARMQDAMKVLRLIDTNTAINESNYQKMFDTVINPTQYKDYINNVFMTTEEITKLRNGSKYDDVISTRKDNIIKDVLKFARNGAGQDLSLNNGNLNTWNAYNAVTGYISRKSFTSYDDRANSMLFGSSATLVEDAGILALEPSKIISLSKISNLNTNFN